jgi:hypothetical protein
MNKFHNNLKYNNETQFNNLNEDINKMFIYLIYFILY